MILLQLLLQDNLEIYIKNISPPFLEQTEKDKAYMFQKHWLENPFHVVVCLLFLPSYNLVKKIRKFGRMLNVFFVFVFDIKSHHVLLSCLLTTEAVPFEIELFTWEKIVPRTRASLERKSAQTLETRGTKIKIKIGKENVCRRSLLSRQPKMAILLLFR